MNGSIIQRLPHGNKQQLLLPLQTKTLPITLLTTNNKNKNGNHHHHHHGSESIQLINNNIDHSNVIDDLNNHDRLRNSSSSNNNNNNNNNNRSSRSSSPLFVKLPYRKRCCGTSSCGGGGSNGNGSSSRTSTGCTGCIMSRACYPYYNNMITATTTTTTRKMIYLISPFLFILMILLCVYVGQRILSFYYKNLHWEHPPYHFISRTCTPPNYYTYTDYYNSLLLLQSTTTATTTTTSITKMMIRPKICITTLTDENNKSFINKILGWRNFDGIMALTWENKYLYAQRHGYYIYDESHVVNHTRGPSWFKIIAVLRLLQVEHCDWVFWMDADMVIMNSTIRLEDFLPYYRDDDNDDDEKIAVFEPQQPNYDILLSMDLRGATSSSSSADGMTQIVNGTHYSTTNTGIYNAGAWIIRNSEWSINFLTTWWNMKSYVQPIGHSFSGDNHALKDLLRYNVSNFDDHCLVPSRCTFNSFAKFIRNGRSNYEQNQQIISERTNNEAYYHQTDFVAHVAGVDNKRDTINMLLELAQ